jgi:hypothetical protein
VWIWNELAQHAVVRQISLFMSPVPTNTYLRLFLTRTQQCRGWKTEIESVFTKVAIECGLPFGVGCVAFRDEAFCVFGSRHFLCCTALTSRYLATFSRGIRVFGLPVFY